MELRVVIHAPRGRDAAVVRGVLESHHWIEVCNEPAQLAACLDEGAGAAILTEESLAAGDGFAQALSGWLSRQPSWSDFPFIVLATKQPGRRSAQAIALLHSLGNVILLERPLNAETLTSAADAAVRARRRQYATRQHLEEIGRNRAEMERLNSELEARILDRTRELASANDRLMKEIAEREKAQAALTQGQKMEAIGRLTGGIAHDFNNLLHVVNMNLELISLYAKEEKVKPVVDRAKSAARRGAKLTGQLLSFARSQSLLPKLTHVNTLLVGMKDLLEISAGPSVAVELELCEDQAIGCRGSQPARDGRAEPGGEFARCHARGRRPHDFLLHAAQARTRPSSSAAITWWFCQRHGRGHSGGAAEQGLRSLLHDQAAGQRYRARPEPGLWICAAVGRRRLHPQRTGKGHHREMCFPLRPSPDAHDAVPPPAGRAPE